MSFLSDLIDKLQSRLEDPAFDLTSAKNFASTINDFKEDITDRLCELHSADNLRVFDSDLGGVIRGPKQSRLRNHGENEKGVLSCNLARFERCSEVSYFRALFNLPDRSFNINSNSKVRLIGYESPLMRKKTDTRNIDIKSRTIACDLVGLTSHNQLLCIEGKVNPHDDATNIVYGLLEGFAYGVAVEYFLSDNKLRVDLTDEVLACSKEFHPNTNGKMKVGLTSAFSLAAPREYFKEYFSPTRLGTERAHNKLKKKVNNQLSQTRNLLAAFKNVRGPAWAGFMILEPIRSYESFDGRNCRTIDGRQLVEPHFKPNTFKAHIAQDVDELRKSLGLLESKI